MTVISTLAGDDGEFVLRQSISNESRDDATNWMTMTRNLQRDNEMLRARLHEYDTMRLSQTKNSGKNATRKMKESLLTPGDNMNVAQINHYLKDVLFPHIKMLPRGWANWNTNPRSICQRLMKVIAVPHGMTPQQYWESVVTLVANDKSCSMRANVKQDMLNQYKGIFLLPFRMRILDIDTHTHLNNLSIRRSY